MNITYQIAKLFRDVYHGGNWTAVNIKSTLADVDWKQATTKLQSFNTIAILVYHINWYVEAVTKVLNHEPLEGNDKDSFNLSPVESAGDWLALQQKMFANADALAKLIEEFPVDKLDQTFVHEKYGTYYRNLHGLIEHNHYHLGQIVLIKKMLTTTSQ